MHLPEGRLRDRAPRYHPGVLAHPQMALAADLPKNQPAVVAVAVTPSMQDQAWPVLLGLVLVPGLGLVMQQMPHQSPHGLHHVTFQGPSPEGHDSVHQYQPVSELVVPVVVVGQARPQVLVRA